MSDQLTLLHSMTSQKTRILNINAEETWNLTYVYIAYNSPSSTILLYLNINTKNVQDTQNCKIADKLHPGFTLEFINTTKEYTVILYILPFLSAHTKCANSSVAQILSTRSTRQLNFVQPLLIFSAQYSSVQTHWEDKR